MREGTAFRKAAPAVDDRMRAAHRQVTEGTATQRELARLYGVTPYTISQWVGKVQDALDIEKLRGQQ